MWQGHVGALSFLWACQIPRSLGQGTIPPAHRGPHSTIYSELVHVAEVLAKKMDGRRENSYGSGGGRRMLSQTWFEASLCNVPLHVS